MYFRLDIQRKFGDDKVLYFEGTYPQMLAKFNEMVGLSPDKVSMKSLDEDIMCEMNSENVYVQDDEDGAKIYFDPENNLAMRVFQTVYGEEHKYYELSSTTLDKIVYKLQNGKENNYV